MHSILRLLGFYLCIPIYETIAKLYEIFYYLASARFFSGESANVVRNLSNNLYVLISIVMLFVFSATMLAAIVNPDLIEDKKKGVGAVFKRGIIGIVLIVAIPFVFDKIYEYQDKIINSNLIERTLVGMEFNKSNDKRGGNGGYVIAGNLISSVLYPYNGSDAGEVTIQTTNSADAPQEAYNDMITDVSNMSYFAEYLNAEPKTGGAEYAFEFNGIIAIIAGLAADYILLLFAMDMAVRLFKLAFYELTAPISVFAYIAAGGDTFMKWAKAVGSTFAEVFVRIAAMAFYLFLISNLNNFLNSETWEGEGVSWKLLLKLLLIIGMLIFVHKIPELLKVFGLNLEKTNGIKGRLESMAGVGKQAGAAWDKMKQAAKVLAPAAAVVASGPIGWGATAAGVGAGLTLRHGWKKGIGGPQVFGTSKGPTKDTAIGKAITATGKGLKTVGSYAGAFLGAEGLGKGISEVSKKYNESDRGKNKAYEKELEAEEEIKAKVRVAVDAAVKGLPNILKNADGDLDLAAMYAAGTYTLPAHFQTLTQALKKHGVISDSQEAAMNKYNDKQYKLSQATEKKQVADNLTSYLDNAISSSGGGAKALTLSSIRNKIASGESMSENDVRLALTTGGFTVGDADFSSIVGEVSSALTKIDAGRTATTKIDFKQVSNDVTTAQNELNGATDKLDKAIENGSSEVNKRTMKNMKSGSDKMYK